LQLAFIVHLQQQQQQQQQQLLPFQLISIDDKEAPICLNGNNNGLLKTSFKQITMNLWA
jgi:hypothetical protein